VADQKFPELITHRPHQVGHENPHTFEDALRDLVRNSPYLGISLVLHGIIFAILYNMGGDPLDVKKDQIIQASAEDVPEPIPPPPPPPEKEPEEIEEVIEEPTVTEEVTTEITEVVDNVSDAPFDNTGQNDAIGVGAGAGGNFGRRGKAGSRGKTAGKPQARNVDDALRWLKNHQSQGEGLWACNEFDLECGKQGDDGPCTGRGLNRHDVGVTGLALLAFLGAGNTDTSGAYRDVVKAGMRYLLKVQDKTTGNFADPSHLEHTYDHMLATLAVIECYALTNEFKYKTAALKGLDYMYSLRNAGAAWRYGDPSDPQMVANPNDVSATGWAIMAMTLARDYDLPIDAQALEDSYAFIEEMTDSKGRTGYVETGGGSSRISGIETTWTYEETEAMTAVGVLSRIFIDPKLERPGNKEAIEKGVKLMQALPIVWNDAQPGRKDFYYWYYATYAMFQWGGADWNKWSPMIQAVADAQIQEGEAKGSWDPQLDPWGSAGGRVYTTAILALLMEVYYRYDNVIGSH